MNLPKIKVNDKLLKNEWLSHLLVMIAFFLFFSLLRFKFDYSLIFLWLGGLMGTYLLDIDHLVYWFVAHPEKVDSLEAQRIVGDLKKVRKLADIKDVRTKISALYRLLKENHSSHNRLIFHTIVFQIVLLLLTAFVMTSSGNYFGVGLVLAMNVHLLKDVWQDYLTRGAPVVADWFLWQVKEWGVDRYLKEYLVLVTFTFLLITRLFI